MTKYVEVEVSSHFDDDKNTLLEALEEGADVGLSKLTSRATLEALLLEARDNHVTDKPWDDRTHLHDRISDVLDLPRSYPDHPRD